MKAQCGPKGLNELGEEEEQPEVEEEYEEPEWAGSLEIPGDIRASTPILGQLLAASAAFLGSAN